MADRKHYESQYGAAYVEKGIARMREYHNSAFTVRELIAELAKFDHDLRVYRGDIDLGPSSVTEVGMGEFNAFGESIGPRVELW